MTQTHDIKFTNIEQSEEDNKKTSRFIIAEHQVTIAVYTKGSPSPNQLTWILRG